MLFVLLWAVWFWSGPAAAAASESREEVKAAPNSAHAQTHVTGRIAAQSYCQTCHLLPEPETLDQKTWRDELLPKMKYFTGLAPPTTNYFADLDVLLKADVFPKTPMMPQKAWDAIVEYYVSAAPEKLVSPQDQSKIAVGLQQFTVVPAKFRRAPPHTTLVRIDPVRHEIVMGDAQLQGVDFLDANGALVSTVPLGNIPVGMTETTRTAVRISPCAFMGISSAGSPGSKTKAATDTKSMYCSTNPARWTARSAISTTTGTSTWRCWWRRRWSPCSFSPATARDISPRT